MPRVSVGSSGAIRAHWASENQKKSAIENASSQEALNHSLPNLRIPFMGPDPNLLPSQAGEIQDGAQLHWRPRRGRCDVLHRLRLLGNAAFGSRVQQGE